MTALAIRDVSLRTRSVMFAQYLAIAFAFAIPLSNAATTVLSILLVVTCLMQMDRSTWSKVLKHPIAIAILIFMAINLLDCVYTIAASKEISLTLRKSSRLLYFLLLLPLFSTRKMQVNAIIAFIAAVIISVIAAIIAGGVIFKDSIFTSLFTAYAIFVLAHLSIEYKKYHWHCIILASCLTFYLLFIGWGRVGQVLFIVLSLLFMWQRFAYQWRKFMLGICLLAAIITLVLLGPSSFSQRNARALREIKQYMQLDESAIPYESSMGTRLLLARNSWELIKLKPILGWGTGAFVAAYAEHAPETQIKEIRRANPHNQYLLTWVELGLPGLLSLFGIFTCVGHFFWQRKYTLDFLGMGLLLAYVVGCTMNSWLLDFTSAFFFVFMLAVCAGTAGSPDDKRIRSV